jgi:putative ABC transport system permease protein
MIDEQKNGRVGLLVRALVRLYPRAFREAFGEEIAQFMRDRSREPRYRAGWRGRAALAAHLIGDTTRAAARARLHDASARARAASHPRERDPRPENRMDNVLQDLHFSIRMLRRRPGFALVAMLTIMLGIGANTAIFSVVNAVLLRPLPYPAAERLVVIWGTRGEEKQAMIPVADMADLQERNRSLDDIGIVRIQSVNLTGLTEPDRLVGNFVSAQTLRLLGARMSLGRGFTPNEAPMSAAGQRVAVLSNAAWQTRFGSDPGVIGRTLTLNGSPHVVIGIGAPDFRDAFGPIDVWLPVSSAPNASWFTRGAGNIWAIGRLRPGLSVTDAQRDLAGVASQLAKEYPKSNAGTGINVMSLRDNLVGGVRPILIMVLVFVALVLLIACANVANLHLARAATRQREMALRAALGARRSRIVRQLLTESLVISTVGGGLGLLLARWSVQVLVAAVPGGLPLFGEVGIEPRVLLFAAGITIASGLLFGAAPAIHGAQTDLSDSLKLRASEAKGGRRIDIRDAFVVFQLALCIVLLVGAGLLTRSLSRLAGVDPGFDSRNVLTAEFRLPAVKYKDSLMVREFMQRVIGEIRSVPGVRTAALVSNVPLSGNFGHTTYLPAGQPTPSEGSVPSTQYNTVTSGFFRTLGIPLQQGRDFDDRDRTGAEPVVIVNSELARRAWPNESPLSKRLTLPEAGVAATVIGVVASIKQYTLGESVEPQLYVATPQFGGIFSSVVVRTDGDPMQVAKALRSAIWTVDPDQPVWKIRSLESLVVRDTAGRRFTMLLTGAFAALALLLATVGVYGVMSFAVTQRTREVGIRMALGGRRRDVISMVLGRGLRVVGIAMVLGIIAALGASRLMQAMLFGIGPSDAVTFVSVPALLALVACIACYLPARRAARVNPMIALQSE